MLAEKALKQGVRALILVPSSELVKQNHKEHFEYTSKPDALGICSAKLLKVQTKKQIVYATYTSFLRRRDTSGAFNLLVIDEAHYVSNDPETSYQKIITSLLKINPAMKICGLTATPYRSDQGMLHERSIKGDAIFTNCSYETNIPKLIEEGYLSHVESISGDIEIDLTDVKLKGQDFDPSIVGVKFQHIAADAVADMRVKFETYNIQTAIIYASTLENARTVLSEWGDDSTMRIAYGDMSTHDRNEIVRWIREGQGKRYIVNIGLFVTGFDYQQLDCVVFFVATKSLVKYVQIAGRVIRAHDDKALGYVLDYGSNIDRHGPIDATIPPKNKNKIGDAPKKLCLIEGCGFPNPLSAKFCKECGAMFVIKDDVTGLYSMRSKAEILAAKETETFDVHHVSYQTKVSSKNDKKMIKMAFYGDNNVVVHDHYICLEYDGFAGDNARRFLMDLFVDPKDFYTLGRSHTTNADHMLILLSKHRQFFKEIESITLKKVKGSKFKEIKSIKYK